MKGKVKALLVVPLVIMSEAYGVMTLCYRESRESSGEELDLCRALSHQVSLAVQNSWLRVQAEENAAAKERSRISSDLHDAVTQGLFAASLTAEALPQLLAENPAAAGRSLVRLQSQVQRVFGEMRALLLGLRPASFGGAGIEQMLEHLVKADSRSDMPAIELRIKGKPSLPADVQVAFYRIAQEALNNVVQHACANSVVVALECSRDGATLSIKDDGSGFDPRTVDFGHLGVGIMRERAESIGAAFAIECPGRGTEVCVAWGAPRPGESR